LQFQRKSKIRANQDGTITKDYLDYLYNQEKCCWCAAEVAVEDRTLEHITELGQGGSHSIYNTHMACQGCNSARLNRNKERNIEALGFKYKEELMNEYIKAKIVGYTQPSEEFKDSFNDVKELVAYCARVSNPSNQFNNETADKLISYLIKHQHWSPLEMASVTMEVETTRDIARQFLRHRSFAFQEFSQRYADPTKDMEFVLREARLQDTKNRQNSIETNDPHLQATWDAFQQSVIDAAIQAYNWGINNGIAKEQCRAVLPEGNTKSRLYVQGSIRSWIHYIQVREHESTQKEHRILAQAVAKAISAVFKI